MMVLVYYFYFIMSLIDCDYFLFMFFITVAIMRMVITGPIEIDVFSSVDFLSWVLIILLFFLFVVMIIGSIDLLISTSSFFFFFLMGTLVLFIYVCFVVTNYFLFYLAFECSVVPIFLVILGWGFSHERLQAGMYLFIYTLLLSLPFLFFLVSLSDENGMSDWMLSSYYYDYKCGVVWVFLSISVFLVKFPFYWLHLWLPKAHVEAPLSGSMVLAGVLLKLGGYGFMRFYYYFMSYFYISCFFFFGGLMGGLFAMFICFRQVDMKCMVAYMSVSHMSFLASAFMSSKLYSLFGFLMMMISHGFSSSGMFALLGVCYARLHSRSMLMMKSNFYCISLMGLWGFMLCLSSMSCPPSINFFSEIFLVWGMASFGAFFFFMGFVFYFMMGSLSVVHFFMVLFHGKYSHFVLLGPLLLSDSFLLLVHIAPLLVGFLFF